jgi:ketosteroid isomerase-like protein
MATASTFDTSELKRAIEERDAAAQLAMFADDAEVITVDKANPPSNPQRLVGRAAIGEFLEDVFGRDMTHTVSGLVVDGDNASYTINCQYPDGSRVMCMAALELRDGQIIRQTGLQAWDEA